MNNNKNELTIFMPSLHVGGAEMVVIRLLEGLVAKGIKVDLVLATKVGVLRKDIPNEVNLIDLNASRTIYSLYKLIRYLRNNKPKKLLSHLQRANRIAILAKIIARSNTDIYLVNHTMASIAKENASLFHKILSFISYRYLYGYATKLIHVSNGAARDLEKVLNISEGSVEVIYNPVVTKEMLNGKKYKSIPHPWFLENKIPVVISAGSFRKVKRYDILIKAFYIIQKKMKSRLIILGDGPLRNSLEDLVKELELTETVSMPGFVDNVYNYMNNASVFVLSSQWEALPTVIIEALACGCQIVSTNCPNGPYEILEGGKYGRLIEMNSPQALASAIEESINSPIPKKILRDKASQFTVNEATEKYIEVLDLNYSY